ncbi:MAG: hypothetical protein ABI881_03010 [Betaproteobacteria bacterium]
MDIDLPAATIGSFSTLRIGRDEHAASAATRTSANAMFLDMPASLACGEWTIDDRDDT